jgi:LTXXQ motif family protein
MNRVSLAAAVAAALSVTAMAASAQSVESPAALEIVAQATPSERSNRERAAGEQRAFRMPSERLEERLTRVRAALQITDSQQAQWDQLANVLRAHAREMDQRIQTRMAQREQSGAQRPERPQLSAIERLELQQQRLAQRTERLNEVVSAARPLYAAFTPEQQQIADKMLAREGHRRGHHGGGHRHPHQPGMHGGA